MSEIVLASGSPRRKELLEKAGLKFSVLAAGGEEKTVKKRPEDVVEELSAMKARGTARLLEEDGRAGEGLLVIAADTVVAFHGEILGKPASKEDAVKTLLRL